MNEPAVAIDTDPDALRRSAEIALHAADQAWTHIRAEYAAADGDYDKLLATLRPTGPYGYTIQPRFHEDGTVQAPILSTRDEIRVGYEEVRGRSDLLLLESFVEVRGGWYMFHEAVSTGRLRANNPDQAISPPSHVIGIFPSASGPGITGELVWPRVPQTMLGRGDAPEDLPTDPFQIRRNLIALLDAYRAGFAAGDAEKLVGTMNDDVQSAVRDYVTDTGMLTELDGKAATLSYYAALFEKFEIISVDLLHQVVQDWYVFMEIRVTMVDRDRSARVSCNIGEFYVIGKDQRFFVRIGHGTDLAPAG